jgi:hypothetical protein
MSKALGTALLLWQGPPPKLVVEVETVLVGMQGRAVGADPTVVVVVVGVRLGEGKQGRTVAAAAVVGKVLGPVEAQGVLVAAVVALRLSVAA